MSETLLSVGIDIGTSTTQLILSRLTLANRANPFSVPRIAIEDREVLYRSGIHFTPLLSDTVIDAEGVRTIVAEEYRKSGFAPEQVDTGAVIITGETARKENAREVLSALSQFAGDFVVATAGPDLESILAARGAGADEYSREHHTDVLHFDIGGGTSNLALYSHGELAATGCESYYRGPLMEQIVAFSQATGGYFCEDDFRNYKPEWVEPISTDYKGYTVCEIPPNGHGITVLMALNLLKGLKLSDQKDCADTYHKILESIKLAFADTRTYVADPRYMRTRVEDLLSEEYAARRRALISEQALTPEAGDPSCGGTIYLCTADPQGNMVSFIQSNYTTFGAGVAIPGTGISLQNRGANFSLDEGSDNCLAGGKRSYHTIIPGFLMRDGEAKGPFGVMGVFMQPQGHVQVLTNMIDFHMNPQEALDAPRWMWTGEKKISLERLYNSEMADKLTRTGHDITIPVNSLEFGRGQIILRDDEGTLCGATEPRTDGTVAVW